MLFNHSLLLTIIRTCVQIILMIVCICRRLNEKKITEAIEAGADSAPAVMKHHKTRFNCGQCRHDIADMVAESQTSENTNNIAAE